MAVTKDAGHLMRSFSEMVLACVFHMYEIFMPSIQTLEPLSERQSMVVDTEEAHRG